MRYRVIFVGYRNGGLMKRYALSVIWLVASLSMCTETMAADAAKSTSDPARCARFARFVDDHQTFTDGKTTVDRTYSPDDVFAVVKTCPSQPKLQGAFDTLYGFMEVQGQEGGPHGQELAPDATTLEVQQIMTRAQAYGQKAVNGYKQKVKDGSLDEQTLKSVARYLIWQRNLRQDPSYINGGLELMARMYPQDYPSLKTLSQEDGGQLYLWDSIRDEWLPKTPPANH